MSNPNPERDERVDRMLQVIVETPAGERIRMTCGAADLRSVITDILESQPYVVNTVDAERLADYHKIGSMPAIIKSTDYGADSLAECVEKAVDRWYHRGRRDAATLMRDRCVDAIKTLRATPHGAAYNNAINDAIHKVESLTLEQGEQK